MQSSSDSWLSKLGMEDSTLFHQYHLDFLDYSIDPTNFQSFFSENHIEPRVHNSDSNNGALIGIGRPMKKLNINIGLNSCTSKIITSKVSPSSSSKLICFENLTSSSSQDIFKQVNGLEDAMINHKNEGGSSGNTKLLPLVSQGSCGGQFCSPKHMQETKRVGLMSQDHVIAERKRRENLRQHFITLSALIPGRKKMDKASVLEDAFNYLKELQERVKTLDEQAARKTNESAIVVKKSHLCTADGTSSSDENFNGQSSQYLPEIEAKVSDRDVLIRIHCLKNKAIIANILGEIEKLHLTVVNSQVLPFGKSTLDITVVAQMEGELATTVKDLAKNLRLALMQFM